MSDTPEYMRDCTVSTTRKGKTVIVSVHHGLSGITVVDDTTDSDHCNEHRCLQRLVHELWLRTEGAEREMRSMREQIIEATRAEEKHDAMTRALKRVANSLGQQTGAIAPGETEPPVGKGVTRGNHADAGNHDHMHLVTTPANHVDASEQAHTGDDNNGESDEEKS